MLVLLVPGRSGWPVIAMAIGMNQRGTRNQLRTTTVQPVPADRRSNCHRAIGTLNGVLTS